MAMFFVVCGLIIVEVFFNLLASGMQLDSKYEFDLIDGLRIYNNTYLGLSVVEGINRFTPAILLKGDLRHLQIPSEMFERISELLSQTNELTFLATLKQDERNSGSLISFSEGNDRFLEVQSSGRKDEIRLHYIHKNNTYVETFPYQLADNSWHQVAVTISGNTVHLYVDCVQIYKRIIYDIDTDFASRNLSLWLGQRNSRHFLFKGCLQDVKVVGHSHGYILQCPQLDTGCPTCGQFRQLQMSVLKLENHINELTQRLAYAEQQISELNECECQKSCLVNRSVHADGATWKNGCDICSCVHGQVKCRPVTCAPTQCKHPVKAAGECCPVCLKKCLLENISYDHGERVSPIRCVVCECKNGSMHCRRIDPEVSCPLLTCPKEEQFSVPGECCRFCPGIDYCSQGHDCHHNASCLNLRTQYTCHCNRGFTGDGRYCEDINECLAEGGHDGHHCRLFTKCVNLPGDYVCECLPGYRRVDAYNCAEHDECSTGEHECHPNAECINTDGSYICRCLEGYSGDGFNCEPLCSVSCINGGECISPNTCSCRHGYSGSSCEIDVDECALGLHICHPTSQCVNMPGWYYCKCRPGYETYPDDNFGAYCQDIDECIGGSHTCHVTAACVNEDGSYRCECPDNSSCSSSCLYYGEERRHRETWFGDLCTKCHCLAGVVICQPVECDCSDPNINFECCPHCDHSSVCQHQETQVTFQNGEQWIYQCQICECLYGEIDCWDMECPPLTCDSPYQNPGDCCPRCENDPCRAIYNNSSSPKGCSYNGHIYQTGEKIPHEKDICSTCKCQDGNLCCSFNITCADDYSAAPKLLIESNHSLGFSDNYSISNSANAESTVNVSQAAIYSMGRNSHIFSFSRNRRSLSKLFHERRKMQYRTLKKLSVKTFDTSGKN